MSFLDNKIEFNELSINKTTTTVSNSKNNIEEEG